MQLANEFCQNCAELLDQSLIKIRHCLDQLEPNQIWWRPESSLNSIGNLALHITGNLGQWGIAPITGENVNRQRREEFEPQHHLSKQEIDKLLAKSTEHAKALWSDLSSARLLETQEIQGFQVSLLQAILHTSSHFVGHTHQIILLTRQQLGQNYRFQWTPELERGQLPI